MSATLQSKLQNFTAINLTELNATASFLKRIDRKFLITEQKLHEILTDLQSDFQALEIGGKRIFSYDNVYMDTNDYHFYNQHENRINGRTKIRTRLYTDSNMAFFEYKQKEDWVTKKFRYQFPTDEHGLMTKGKIRFFEGVYQSLYNTPAPKITPAINTKYKRLTLVNKDGSERLTIDFNISTKDLRGASATKTELKNLVIIESKSMSENCKSAEIMKKHAITQAKACSKYSLGVVYSGLAEKWDTFKNTMEQIALIRVESTNNRKRQPSPSLKKTLNSTFTTKSLEEVKKILS